MPYWEQVIEQQYAYCQSVAHDLANYAPGRFWEIWYEDVCRNPAAEIHRLHEYWFRNRLMVNTRGESPPMFALSEGQSGESDDLAKICDYVARQAERFRDCRYAARSVNRKRDSNHYPNGTGRPK